MNVVLDAETMGQLNAVPAGPDPEQAAFQPGGPYALVAHMGSDALVVLDASSGDLVGSIPVGSSQGNVTFRPDGAYAYVTGPGSDEVFVIDMASLSVAGSIPTGGVPLGIVLLDWSISGKMSLARPYAGWRGLPAARNVGAPLR
jgi:YVTN family beta-propeller protein